MYIDSQGIISSYAYWCSLSLFLINPILSSFLIISISVNR